MSEQEVHSPSEHEGELQQVAPKSETSIADLEAQASASLANREEIKQAEASAETADRQGQVELFLMENEMFGYEPYSEEVMASLTTLLLEMEGKLKRANPDFDITSDWDTETVKSFLERKHVAEEAGETRDTDFKNRDSYQKAVDTIRQEYPDLDNLSLCSKLVENHAADIPPEYLSRIQTFVRIQQLAATPEDAAIVTAKINSLNFADGIPDPVLFVQGSIFNDPNLSEQSKVSIATELNIPRPNLVTGTQTDRAMDATDAEGKPLYTPSNPLSVRDGVDAYVAPDGSRVARVEVDGVGVREIPWERGENGNIIGLKLSLIKIWAANEANGNTDFFGETVNIDTQIVSQTDPEKLRKVQQVMEALLGGDAGYDGEIITDEQAEYIGWFNQYTATKGDAAKGDFDRNTAILNRAELGLHPNGDASQIDYDVLRAAGSFAQGQYGSGAPEYDAMQSYLKEFFPEKEIGA